MPPLQKAISFSRGSPTFVCLLAWTLVVAPETRAQTNSCVESPSPLAAWWPLESDGTNLLGASGLELLGAPAFVPAKVGQGFEFDGFDDRARVAASAELDLGAGPGFSIELWVRPAHLAGAMPLVEWNDGQASVGLQLWLSVPLLGGGPGSVFASLADTSGVAHWMTTPPGLVSNDFAHVALTYDQGSGTARLFVNGQPGETADFGNITVETRLDLWVGYRPQDGQRFVGVMDEISFHSRALTPAEVAQIANAGSFGKCRSAFPPVITRHPSDLISFAGSSNALEVSVAGDAPLHYQWQFNGAILGEATNRVLVFPNLTLAHSGNYFVVVTNALGSATSSVAEVTVNVPGTCTPAPAGLLASWPLNESAVDLTGGHHGILLGSPHFVQEGDWQGLQFDRVDDAVRVPASSAFASGMAGGFTIELWVKPDNPGASDPLVEWFAPPESTGVTLWTGLAGPGSLWANLVDTGGIAHPISAPAGSLSNRFAHVALTYDRSNGVARIFVNGTQAGESTVGSFAPETRWDLYLGRRPGSPYGFGGVLDEVSLYNRPLSAKELQKIASVGGVGKCGPTGPPTIVQQPQPVTAFVGDVASFSVLAAGAAPLSYQWFHNGLVLTGANSAMLLLTNLQRSQAGPYSVTVTNAGGARTSVSALLTVLDPSECVPTPSGLVAWWPMQFTAGDFAGDNPLTIQGNPAYVLGRVGMGLHFDGFDDSCWIPAAAAMNLGSGAAFSIEFWVQPSDPGAAKPLIEWNNNLLGGVGALVWTSVGESRSIYVNLVDTQGIPHVVSTPAGSLSNGWTHVALVYQREIGVAEIYLNGDLATNRFVGTFTPETRHAVYLGARPPVGGPLYLFSGNMDDVSFYDRALAASEIRAIHRSGGSGKCRAPIPPSIVQPPQSLTLFLDETARFEVGAIGELPLQYQWFFNGGSLAAQTNSILVISNTHFGHAGDYSVRVSNAGGAITSSVVTLTVNVIPPCVAPPASLAAWWPLDGDASELVTGNTVTLLGNPMFARGKVGQGLMFDRLDDAGRIPASTATDIGLGPGLTIELWVEPFDLTNQSALIEWNNGVGSLGVHLWIAVPASSGGGGPGSVFASLTDVFREAHVVSSPAAVLTNRPQHLALTYERASGVASVFVDGQTVATKALGSFPPDTRHDVNFGRRPSGVSSEYPFAGVLDEVAFYSRALSDAEVAALFQAGPAGKCRTPLPPAIIEQPQAAALFQGDNLTLTVRAVGTPPLRYEWRYNGSALLGQTNTSLVLSNLQPASAGDYSVVVTGANGATVSSNAMLVVYPLSGCGALPTGLVGWWPLDGTAENLVNGTPGTLIGGPSFPAGLIAQAALFDGIDDAISVVASSNLNVGAGPGLTIEAWINPADGLLERPIVEWNDRLNNVGVALWISTGGRAPGTTPGNLFANVIDTTGVAHRMMSANGVVVQDRWQHIALTWDKAIGVAALYRDAVLVAQSNLGSFTPQTAAPFDLFIGWRFGAQNSGNHFIGSMDELSIYNRALSSFEIQSLHRAYAFGKCKPSQPPVITSQPQSATVMAGAPASFGVAAGGTAPLAFQWWRNGTNIVDATNISFSISAARSADAGEYWVVVTNSAGSVISQVAVLAVTIDRTLSVGTALGQPAGELVSLPVQLVSAGDVAGMTFDLHYNPDHLSAPDVSWAVVLDAAARQVNVPSLGVLRAVFALPSGALSAGTQTLAAIHFRARTMPFDATSEVLPVLVDASRSSGEPILYGTDVIPGSVRILAGGSLADSNGNGRPDVGDATLLLRLLAQLDTTRPWDISRNDLNLNGVLDSGDVIRLLRLASTSSGGAAPGMTAAQESTPFTALSPGATPTVPQPVASIDPRRLTGTNGQMVTVTIQLNNLAGPISGGLLHLDYPPAALRLLNPQALRAGPIVPVSAVTLWSVAPAETNFAIQSGRVMFAVSSATPWPVRSGAMAELTFQVQPGATNQYLWPLSLGGAEITTDGYEIQTVATSDAAFVGRSPLPGVLQVVSRDLSEGFEFWLNGEAGGNYVIETSSNLVAWAALTNIIHHPGSAQIIDPGASTARHRFYRARLAD